MNINEAYLALASAQTKLRVSSEAGKPLSPEDCAKMADEVKQAAATYAELIGGIRDLVSK